MKARLIIGCLLAAYSMVLAAQTSSESADWAERPFVSPFAEAFAWQPADSSGQELWKALRLNWETLPQLPYDEPAPVDVRSAWYWWWHTAGAKWWTLALAVALALAGTGLWWRTRQFPKLELTAFAEHWPELRVIADGLDHRSVDAAYSASIAQIQHRLLPSASPLRPEWNALNDSERECAEFILQRLGPHEIARLMHCTPKHVYNLRSSIRKKLNIAAGNDLDAEMFTRFGSKMR